MRIREVVVTGQNRVELQTADIDTPALAANELLIDTEYTFISSGTELANYTGREPKVFQKGTWCEYPWRSGYANVGIVREVGPGVTRAAPGGSGFYLWTTRFNDSLFPGPIGCPRQASHGSGCRGGITDGRCRNDCNCCR